MLGLSNHNHSQEIAGELDFGYFCIAAGRIGQILSARAMNNMDARIYEQKIREVEYRPEPVAGFTLPKRCTYVQCH